MFRQHMAAHNPFMPHRLVQNPYHWPLFTQLELLQNTIEQRRTTPTIGFEITNELNFGTLTIDPDDEDTEPTNEDLTRTISIINHTPRNCTVIGLKCLQPTRALSWDCHDVPCKARPNTEETIECYLDLSELSFEHTPFVHIDIHLVVMIAEPGLNAATCHPIHVTAFVRNAAALRDLDPRSAEFYPPTFYTALSRRTLVDTLPTSVFDAGALPEVAQPPPTQDIALFNAKRDVEVAEQQARPSNLNPPQLQSRLLQLEKAQHVLDVDKLTIMGVKWQFKRRTFIKDEEVVFIAVTVPGMLEGRPHLVPADPVELSCIYSTSAGEVKAPSYLCRVWNKIGTDEVLLACPHTLKLDKPGPATTVALRFFAQTHAFDFLQTCITDSIPSTMQDPVINDSKLEALTNLIQRVDMPCTFFNDALNPEQKAAVLTTLRRTKHLLKKKVSRLPPFLVWGPPGTGKTETVAESVCQILARPELGSILALCSSDAAADVLAQRLISKMVTSQQMLRLNWPWRFRAELPTPLLAFSRLSPEGRFIIPSEHELNAIPIIICTTMTVSLLPCNYSCNTIIVDEAAQAIEAELYTPLRFATKRTNWVLVGDHNQLGPVVRNAKAREWGLGRSLPERLIQYPVYRPSIDSPLCVRLCKNYRSHPALLELPSRLFYDNQLEACGNPLELDSLSTWSKLPVEHNPDLTIACAHLYDGQCPMLIHGVNGSAIRLEHLGGLCNPAEAATVVSFIQRLLDDYPGHLSPKDFGVIAPYRLQVRLLRKRMREVDLGAVRCGTVDDFQGQEAKVRSGQTHKRSLFTQIVRACTFMVVTMVCLRLRKQIIIVSTTLAGELALLKHRANSDPVGHLMRDSPDWDLLGNRHRFNVAITRAKVRRPLISTTRGP
ncbi:uncharacterized protein MONBRDRAFT_38187 [Monosiga brevicollis MX1]|uniref:Uncharacterized protein n=1 Tax=Monosiga brevicollis TaxID=81824 RepID=A9V667_MONBE|nr:uncharacterized protein MONBRDRAFT_38187 [Monosiga brevicollis MX1]EDQ86935.1 predicted protein [Monosiga brevicollis MX1]|eukprot:XP_001748174.1 hypothetical protein [Monosiga brevicollis MX1]